MENDGGMISRSPHLVMRPEPGRRSYRPQYEGDNISKSLFINATISQDDTQEKRTEGNYLLADMGLGLERKGIHTPHKSTTKATSDLSDLGLKGDVDPRYVEGPLPPPGFGNAGPPPLPPPPGFRSSPYHGPPPSASSSSWFPFSPLPWTAPLRLLLLVSALNLTLYQVLAVIISFAALFNLLVLWAPVPGLLLALPLAMLLIALWI
ncbi:hypothetical protein PG987_014487 [Apiospora arundinis]